MTIHIIGSPAPLEHKWIRDMYLANKNPETLLEKVEAFIRTGAASRIALRSDLYRQLRREIQIDIDRRYGFPVRFVPGSECEVLGVVITERKE
jgi:hypothetical protein